MTQDCILLEHPKTEFFQYLQSYRWLAMVKIESFTYNTFSVIHIQILQGLKDKSVGCLTMEKKLIFPIETSGKH